MSASVMALIMTGLALASCSNGGNNTVSDTTAADNADTATAETTTAELMPDIPEKDFGGAEFMFLTSGAKDSNGADWEAYDVYSAEENGDIINDAVYARNMYVGEKYNVNILEKKSDALVFDEAQAVIMAGDDTFDAITSSISTGAKLARNKFSFDLHEVPYIDLNQPWWDNNLAESLSVAGRMNFATGDILMLDNDAVWVLMFNKQLIEDLSLDNPYELVAGDNWYYDTFEKNVLSSAADLNGDSVLKSADDRFGFTTGSYSGITLLYSAGLKLSAKDENDLPYFALDLERAASAAERFSVLMKTQETLQLENPAVIRGAFEEGRVLYYGEVLQCVIRMRASETDFGVIPWPKFDESQSDYAHVSIPGAARVVNIPITQPDLEMAGTVIEAMAAKSMYTLTPAYYDIALESKYMRDDESTLMLDIILDTNATDLAFVYDWAKLATSVIRYNIANNSGGFMSAVESKRTAFETEMQTTIDTYID